MKFVTKRVGGPPSDLQCLRSAKYSQEALAYHRYKSDISPISSANAIWNQNLGFQRFPDATGSHPVKCFCRCL